MSFAQEMKDFYAGFKATYNVAADIRDAKAKKGSDFDYGQAEDSQPGMFGPGISESKGTKSAKFVPPEGDMKKVIDDNVPEELRPFAYKMAFHESRYNPSAVSPTGATGLFQFTSGTWMDTTGMSIGAHTDGRRDPALNAKAFVKLTQKNKEYLTKALGREPTYGELALAHQQGAGGAEYLITGKGSPKVIASIKKNLAHNNIKVTGREAAAQIASYYGFDLDQPATETAAIPDGGYDTGGYDTDVAPEVDDAPAEDSGYEDDGTWDQASNEQDILAGSRNAAIDVDYAIPDGAKLYAAGDLTQIPTTMYSAEGGSVPWKSETSYLRKQKKVRNKYRPKQTVGALEDLPDVADDGWKPPRKPNPNNKNQNNNPNIKAINDAFDRSTGTPGTSNYVPRSPRVDIGTPGTSNYVPRSPRVDIGTPGTSNYVPRQGVSTGLNSSAAPKPAPIRFVAPKPAAPVAAAPVAAAPVAAAPVAAAPVAAASKPAAPKPKLSAIPINPTKNNFAVKSTGAIRAFAEGGPVDDTEEQVVEPAAAPAPARPAAAIPPQGVTPAGNPRGSNREALAMEQRQAARQTSREGYSETSNAIDAGLKYLTKALGLDRANSAVGPDPQLTESKRKLVNGAIGPNEGPPNQEEIDGIYRIVDPNGELKEGLRHVYAMKKGYEFYMQKGQPEKAAKFAAGVIQYSNLMARRFGYEAVQAGQNGDEGSMVKYAIKAYDVIPDGMDLDVQQEEGGYSVTRKDEDGNVVDHHMLTPQQIFQMATGISQGSGFFEAMMDAAAPGTAAQKAKEAKGKARASNLAKLLPDLKADMEDGEEEAWASAVEDGDYETLNTIMGNVKTRRKDRMQGEARDKAEEARDRRLLQGQEAITKRVEEGRAHQDAASEARTKRQQEADEAKAAKKAADDEAKRARTVRTLAKTKDAYKSDMSAGESEAWDDAVQNNDLEGLNTIIDGIKSKRRDPYYTPPEEGAPPSSAEEALPINPAPATSQSNSPGVTRKKTINGKTYELRGDQWFPV